MACLACVTWRTADVALTQHSDTLETQQRRHQELVNSIESLAEKTGILTSADLCPVRFRLRRADGLTVPLLRPLANLEVEQDGEFRYMLSATATSAGTVDFGLMAPGQYRLTFHSVSGMRMQHEFDVLPGVPIDRLVTCPYASSPSYTVALNLNWPDAIAIHGLLAVCSVERASVTYGDWCWHPPEQSRPVHVLTASGKEPSAADSMHLGQATPMSDEFGILQPANSFRTGASPLSQNDTHDG